MSLESIRARVEAATPGGWHRLPPPTADDKRAGVVLRDEGFVEPVAYTAAVTFDQRHADAAFIARARTDIPALLAVAEAAKAVEASTVCAHDHDASDCPWPALAHALEALEAQP